MLSKFLEPQPVFLLLLVLVVLIDVVVVLHQIFERRLPVIVSIFTYKQNFVANAMERILCNSP